MARHTDNSTPAEECGQHHVRHPGRSSPAGITDNWPERVAVSTAELEAIEIWLKPLLDEIFGAGNA